MLGRRCQWLGFFISTNRVKSKPAGTVIGALAPFIRGDTFGAGCTDTLGKGDTYSSSTDLTLFGGALRIWNIN